MMGTFEVFQDGTGDHRLRLTDADGATLATGSRGYDGTAEARAGCERVRAAAAGAEIIEV